MKRFFLYLMGTLLLLGCGPVQSNISSNPPKLTLEINSKVYDTEQGTYCWGNKCVDMISPEEIMEGNGTIKVAPNKEIKLIMKYKTDQIEAHLSQIKDGVPNDVPMKDYKFNAPSEPGVYYFVASFWWMVPNKPNTSNGDSSYVFAIEVE